MFPHAVFIRANCLPGWTVMPGKPTDQSQSGKRDYVCYHERNTSVWFAVAGQARLNRIVLLIKYSVGAQTIALMGEELVSFQTKQHRFESILVPSFLQQTLKCLFR